MAGSHRLSLRPDGRSESVEDLAGGLLDDCERSKQGVGIAIIEADVVARTGAAIESQTGANDEGNCLGFGLPDGLRGLHPTVGSVHGFMCVFVHQSGQGFGLGMAGSEQNSTAATDSESGCDLLGKLDGSSLLPDELKKCIQVFRSLALDAGNGRKIVAVGLLQIEDIDGPESVRF